MYLKKKYTRKYICTYIENKIYINFIHHASSVYLYVLIRVYAHIIFSSFNQF